MNKQAGCGIVSFFLFVLLCLPSWLYAAGRVHLSELGISTGYASGEHRPEGGDFHVTSFAFRAGFDLGGLQCSFDPFVNAIDADESGVEAGLTVFLRYFERLGGKVSVFGEIGSGPMYLGIDTREQGDAGFNFLNLFGAGFRYHISHSLSLDLAGRYRHLSHAGLRDNDNLGMDSWGFSTGIYLGY
ncbi:acyloxyacyl hydrolase [Prosthecochloris sp. CIB 2401]|uniref:acyloxyacyl hydrolase n=1 Tax=Prosthecochloris sp. CIB 2401 TaxID=1868325 RepID=UPI00080ABB3A|nr:acyloxyacyl hydrolase [Prosthecochloris sp. CIB 2401]ANT65956.1 Lipid A 3-O-deacylase (PagL) [Prosthecochloris sp. CIB 2401]